jgi:hypothetical protein|tara:strand:- start:832 stop:1053 length:222 start_codon:yes stop_codon:yes gene_type:complete
MKDIKQLVGLEANAVADLIQYHESILAKDKRLIADIGVARRSLEFFITLNEDNRAYYEARNIKIKILESLGLA